MYDKPAERAERSELMIDVAAKRERQKALRLLKGEAQRFSTMARQPTRL
jgi:hypothetical protein